MQNLKKETSGERRLGKVLDGILIVLLALLFLQCGIFMTRFIEMRRVSSEIPFDMHMLSASSSDENSELDPNLLVPEVLVVCTEETDRGLYHSTVVMQEVYGVIRESLLGAFSVDAVPLSSDAWSQAVEESGVFVRYSSELPYQVISAFAYARQESAELPRRGDLYIGVREMMLCTDENGTFASVLVRGSSGVFSFSLKTEHTMAEFIAFCNVYAELFARVEMTDMGDEMVLLSLDAISARAIHAARGVPTLLTTNDDFLRLMQFNPDKLNYHVESNGAYVYVESHGILRAGAEELSYQAADPGGIDIASLGADGSDIYAYLQAASNLISRIARMNIQYTGGDASLRLESISSDGTGITMQFAFRCDNILLLREGTDYGLTLTFSGNTLTSMVYRMCIVRRTLDSRRVPLQSWYSYMLNGTTEMSMRLIYNTEDEADSISAQWMQKQTKVGEEGGEMAWAGLN